ncbi:hypothetical protein DL96DRAFT_1581762 [Flagelloscypha sp. PMI_526]|nr:hypothetical protein DL96DRAFT_1581762 [Flagelloscypha sp. PMI_526]
MVCVSSINMSTPYLPLDVWDEVASYLDTKQLLSLCQVNKAILPYPQRHLYRSLRLDNVLANRLMKRSSHHIVYTTSLQLVLTTGQDATRTKQIIAFIQCCGQHNQLQSLAVVHKGSGTDPLVFPAIQELIYSLSNLKQLDIMATTLPKPGDYSTYLQHTLMHPALRGVTLTVDSYVVGLLEKLEKKPIVLGVDLSHSYNVYEQANTLALLGRMFNSLDVSQLSCLTLPDTGNQLRSFLETVQLPMLDQLSIHVHSISFSNLSYFVRSLSNTLAHLEIVSSPSINQDSQWEALIQQIRKFTALRRVTICVEARTSMTDHAQTHLKFENIGFFVDTRWEDLLSWSLRDKYEKSNVSHFQRCRYSISL